MNKHAQALGRLGGKSKSQAKAQASRRNGKLGGRPETPLERNPGRKTAYSLRKAGKAQSFGLTPEVSQSGD